ncbi:MAG: hypothetical protein SF052_18930 [Bacteroidia bacterium]|nr:hypothetical protein [Bacteroidia bacterium]
MKLTKAIFWDTNYDKINWDKNARYVIGKVLNYGTQEDWKEINRYYGREQIIKEVVEIRDLDTKAHHFASIILNVPLTDFACYTWKQFTPAHWNY